MDDSIEKDFVDRCIELESFIKEKIESCDEKSPKVVISTLAEYAVKICVLSENPHDTFDCLIKIMRQSFNLYMHNE